MSMQSVGVDRFGGCGRIGFCLVGDALFAFDGCAV